MGSVEHVSNECEADDTMSNAASESDLHDTSAKFLNTLNTSNSTNIENLIMMTDKMKAINICNSSVISLSRNVEGMKEDLSMIRQDMHTFKERLSGAEERISALKVSIQTVIKSDKNTHNNYLHMNLGWRIWRTASDGTMLG